MGEINLNKQEEIDKYYLDEDHVNQSKLKYLLKGLDFFKKKLEEKEDKNVYLKEKGGLLIGSVVDSLLTDSIFDDKFYVSKLDKKPSETIQKILIDCHNKASLFGMKDFYFEDHPKTIDLLKETLKDYDWQSNWKIQTKINHLTKGNNKLFYNELADSKGKIIVSLEEYNLCCTVANSLLSNPNTELLFDEEKLNESIKGNNPFNLWSNLIYTIGYQVPVYSKISNIPCKGLIDIELVGKTEDGAILHVVPIDIKTTSDKVLNFHKVVKKYRYDIQAAFYKDLIKSSAGSAADVVTIDPMIFVVESTTSPGTPGIFKTSYNLEDQGRFGTSIHGFRQYSTYHTTLEILEERRGYISLLEEYKFYLKNGWETSQDYVKSDGIFIVDTDQIKFKS